MELSSQCYYFVIYVFTETWLSENIKIYELGFHNYNVYRYDRDNNTSSLSTGGGVLIAINNKFTSQLIIVPNSTGLEILFMLIKLGRKNLIISSFYIPNQSSLELVNNYFYCITYIHYNYPNSHVGLFRRL